MSDEPPATLWIGLAFFGMIAVIQLFVALLGRHELLVTVAICLALMAGLYFRQRWAFAGTALFCFSPLLRVLTGDGADAFATIAVYQLVLVPVLMSAGWFFPGGGRPAHS